MLVNLFRLGFNRRSCSQIAAFIFPLICLSADQEILDRLDDIYNSLGDLDTSIDALSSSTSDFLYYINQDTSSTVSKLEEIRTDIDQLTSILSASFSGSRLFVEDQQSHYDINAFRSDFRVFASQNTNQLEAANDKLADILFSVNNLTNYLCTSPSYASFIDSIYTNLPALLLSGYYGSYSLGDQMTTFDFRLILQNLLGRNATMEEIQRFRELVTRFGSGRTYLTDFFSQVPKESDNPFIELYDDLYIGPVSGISKAQFDSLQEMAQLRNYYYGTRPLLQFFEQATNDYPLTQSISITQDSSGKTQSSFSSGFVDTVGSLSSSFMPNVSTNVSGLSTNAIIAHADNSFADFGDQLKDYDNSDLESLVTIVNNSAVIDDLSQALDLERNQDYTFTFDLSALGSGVNSVDLTVKNSVDKTTPLITFLCGVLKVAITCIFIGKAWNDIIKPSPLFFP